MEANPPSEVTGKWDESRLEALMNWASEEGDKSGAAYDCLVPVSGGKDSIFQVEVAKRYGLRVVAVNAVPLARSDLRNVNIDAIRDLGADVIEIDICRPGRARLSREGFLSIGVPNWPQHILSVTVPFHLAMDLGVQLVLWGENPEIEYGGPKDLAAQSEMTAEWFARRGGAEGLSLNHMEQATGLSLQGNRWFNMPTDAAIKTAKVRAAFLGQYTSWSSFRSWFVALSVGFRNAQHPPQGALWPFENLDDPLYLLHDWLKYLKFGFGRCTDHVSISIRDGLLSRADGARIVSRLEGQYPRQYLDWSLDDVLNLLDIDRETFDITCGRLASSALFLKDKSGRLIIESGRPRLTESFALAQEQSGFSSH